MNPATPFDRAFEARLHRFDWTSLPAGDETLPGAAQARCRSCQSYRRLRILKRLQVRQPASRTRSPFPCKAPFSTKTGGILRAEAKTEFPLPVLPMHKQKASVLRWYSTCARPGGSLQNRSHTSASLRGKTKKKTALGLQKPCSLTHCLAVRREALPGAGTASPQTANSTLCSGWIEWSPGSETRNTELQS